MQHVTESYNDDRKASHRSHDDNGGHLHAALRATYKCNENSLSQEGIGDGCGDQFHDRVEEGMSEGRKEGNKGSKDNNGPGRGGGDELPHRMETSLSDPRQVVPASSASPWYPSVVTEESANWLAPRDSKSKRIAARSAH